MRIVMADGAGPIVEPVLYRSHRTLRHSLVALRAWDSYVRTGQRETRVFVFGQGK